MKRKIGLLIVILLLGMIGCGQKQDIEEKQETANESSEVGVTVTETEAEEEYNQQELMANLEKNLEIMSKDPKNTDARLEVIKSQIGLKNYDVALVNLSMLMSINPKIPEIYDLYIQISQEEDNISLATSAVSKAYLYDVQEFLNKVTEDPVFSVESGSFKDKISVEISSNDPEADIYYRYYSDTMSSNNILYTGPIDILDGEVKVYAYALKNGIPSNTVEMIYNVNYPGTPVKFEEPVIEQAVKEVMESELGYLPDTITDIDCWKVSYLNVECDKQSVCLNDLKWMPNLQSLYMYDSDKVVDYSPLQYCKNLSYLYIPNGNLTDLNFVSYMPNLRVLYIMNNNISDIAVLKKCKNLQDLNLSGNPVTGIEEIIADKNIGYLSVSDHQISDYSVLGKIESLYYLSILGFDFDSVQLAKLSELTQLVIQVDWEEAYAGGYYHNPVLKDISYVQNMPNLKYLYLNGVSNEEQLQYLYGLEKLEDLYLYNSEVTDNKEAMEKLKLALPNCDIRY